eukprot:GFUD01045595.1.p1 GENE.GFUD01045595.1~~GFUD01045595.1.p1  ORF type:complete len:148 (+),score=40.85 GFUD01045595.1:85-528(+)
MWSCSTTFLLISPLFLLVSSISPPDCTDGSPASCTCGDGSQPKYDTFPPCELKKGVKKATCTCPPGEKLAPKYFITPPKRPCSKGRPACADKSEVFNLKCSDGGVPTLGVGTFPKCAAGNIVCQDGEDLKCLVGGQLTEEVPNFGRK